MKVPRDLSGADLVKTLCRDWGYRKVHQVGSHIILETEQPSSQRIAIPNHSSLRVGTLIAILRVVAEHKGVPREQILQSF
jgi:predicted RNA binding protein YcfA (HicA-like mRNA interferase family)